MREGIVYLNIVIIDIEIDTSEELTETVKVIAELKKLVGIKATAKLVNKS